MYHNLDGNDDLNAASNPFRPDDDDGGDRPRPLLPVDPSTRLVLAENKYSQDAALCAADAATGRVLFALSKERLTRRKHDGGNVASLVEACLESLNLDLDSVERQACIHELWCN